MRRTAGKVVALACLMQVCAWAQEPPQVVRRFQTAVLVEGTGRAVIEYKALHFNEDTYDQLKANDRMRERLSASLWNRLGKAILDFDLRFDAATVTKGSYEFGIDIGPNDTFSLVFQTGAKTQKIPLQTVVLPNASSDYLSFSLTPTDEADGFMIEARCGRFRSTQVFHAVGAVH